MHEAASTWELAVVLLFFPTPPPKEALQPLDGISILEADTCTGVAPNPKRKRLVVVPAETAQGATKVLHGIPQSAFRM